MSWTLSLMQIRLHFCVTKGHLHLLSPVSQGFQLIIASSARDGDHPFAGCESGLESQCRQTLAKLSPGAHAQRTREIPTSVITAHAPPARQMFCFPIFVEKKMPLCCVLNSAIQEGGWVLQGWLYWFATAKCSVVPYTESTWWICMCCMICFKFVPRLTLAIRSYAG